MDKPENDPPQSREERLAAMLRANLRRRKAQDRAMTSASAESPSPTDRDDGADRAGLE